jgi:hypothetical protein
MQINSERKLPTQRQERGRLLLADERLEASNNGFRLGFRVDGFLCLTNEFLRQI